MSSRTGTAYAQAAICSGFPISRGGCADPRRTNRDTHAINSYPRGSRVDGVTPTVFLISLGATGTSHPRGLPHALQKLAPSGFGNLRRGPLGFEWATLLLFWNLRAGGNFSRSLVSRLSRPGGVKPAEARPFINGYCLNDCLSCCQPKEPFQAASCLHG